ncbi:MAG: hypothetical protein ACM3ZA_15455 [Bacillota bacterium]
MLHRTITGHVGEGRHRLDYTAVATEGGLTVTLTGGDRAHVGAVAVAQPRPSHKDPERTSATTSVIAVLGHQDDEVARPLAHLLAVGTGLPAAASVGIHWDHCTPDDIAASRSLVMEAGRAVLAALRG